MDCDTAPKENNDDNRAFLCLNLQQIIYCVFLFTFIMNFILIFVSYKENSGAFLFFYIEFTLHFIILILAAFSFKNYIFVSQKNMLKLRALTKYQLIMFFIVVLYYIIKFFVCLVDNVEFVNVKILCFSLIMWIISMLIYIKILDVYYSENLENKNSQVNKNIAVENNLRKLVLSNEPIT